MRKRIALILALAMLFSMIVPMSASAATSNRVTTVPTVQEDDILADTTYGDASAPFLVIEDDVNDLYEANIDQHFILRLENAEWLDDDFFEDATGIAGDTFEEAMDAHFTSSAADGITVERISDTRIEVLIADGTYNGEDIRVPMWTEITDTGDARVTIGRGNSAVTTGTYTFATAIDDDTVVTIDDIVTFGPDDTAELEDLVIDETVAGAIDFDDTFEFTLPRDFEWANEEATLTGSPVNLTSFGAVTGIDISFGGGLDFDADELEVSIDGRDLEIKFTDQTKSQGSEGYIVIKGLEFEADGARFGDVDLRVSGALTSQTLTVAEYVDYAVDVSADGDLEEIVAGRFDDAENEEGYELTTLLIEEKIKDSIVAGREVTVEFPSWVKITAVDIDEIADGVIDFDEGDSDFSFTPSDSGQDEIDLEIDIEVTVQADAPDGEDIVATLTGRGLDTDYEVALGVVVAPVTVEMEMSEIVIGESGQTVADITITENVAGALMDDEDLVIEFDSDLGIRFHRGYEVEVLNEEESGLDIDDVDVDGGVMTIEIDRASDDEPGVIQISNLLASLDRVPATGDYDVSIGGAALVNNNVEEGDTIPGTSTNATADWFEDDDYVWEAPMLRVVTERTVEAVDVAFTVGQNSYMVDGEMKVMDVAPFISDDRLMVPVRYLEDLFGMQPIWNANARSVTVMYDGSVYAMTIGSDMLTVNGAPYMELDANAQIVDARTFVPASRFARAMGIEYDWDAVTQTATFSK